MSDRTLNFHFNRTVTFLAAAIASGLLIQNLFLAQSISTVLPWADVRAERLAAFLDNLRHGNLFPIWAAQLNKGYGSPELAFGSPILQYLLSICFLITQKTSTALLLTLFLLTSLAFVGFQRLTEGILARRSYWISIFGAAAYALNPLSWRALYDWGSLEMLAAFAVFPWLALAVVGLAQKFEKKSFGLCAIASAALMLSDRAAILPITIALAVGLLIFKPKNFVPLVAALTLGAVASAFYWAPLLAESNLLRPLRPVSVLIGLADLPAMFAFGGSFFVLGFGWAFFRICTHGPWQQPTLSLGLVSGALLMALAHLSPVAWKAFFAETQITWHFYSVIVFLGSVLGVLALSSISLKLWQMQVLVLALALSFFMKASTLSPATYPPLREAALKLAPAGFKTSADSLAEFVKGRGDARCVRQSPTQVDCHVLAIQHAFLRLNILAYPGWRASIDGKNARVDHEPRDLVAELSPGQHEVHWEFTDTPQRATAKLLSLLASLLITTCFFKINFVRKRRTREKQHSIGL